MTGSTGCPVRRWVRRFALGSGPLKRTSDRVQMLARVAVLLAVLAAPAVAVAAAGTARGHLEATAAAQAADRHRVRAVVTGTTTTTVAPEGGDTPVTVVRASVAWPDPSGSTRRADVTVDKAAPAGSCLTVWVDRAGRPTTAPLDRAGVDAGVTTVVLGTLVAVPLAAAGGYGLLCAGLDLSRRRRWTREWERAEREWRTGTTR